MSDIQPELWVEHPSEAIAFYQAAFGAVVAHRVGDSKDIVAQLAVGNARFWIANADAENGRCHPADSAAAPAAPCSSSMTRMRSWSCVGRRRHGHLARQR